VSQLAERSQAALTILDAMKDERIFAPWFQGKSWIAWKAFLKALFGLKMGKTTRKLYHQHTGRNSLPANPSREAWLVVGRRGGKSLIAALVAVFVACFRDYRGILAPGERATVMVLAADRRQARTVFRYIAGFLDAVPMLGQMIQSRTQDTINLTNRITIEVHSANFRAIRGYAIVAAICDEISFWRSEESANPDTEILKGLRPGRATIPDALLLCISSP
jgi:phage terminase large subunit-like protein